MLIVQKYGGTSVGTPEHILRVADRIATRHRAGDRLVIVVSAMGQTTDELLTLAGQVSPAPSRRELDMLLTAGERISMALLSMALGDRSVPAISFTGSQSGIITDTNHGRARILEMRPIRIGPELDRGRVVIVAGFQGVSREKEVTTLGRGGSDTTAVALACGLGADRCEIYSDVDGVLTADPRLIPSARLCPVVPWDVMLELARCGAGVMHARAVALATATQTPFAVRSAFHEEPGTMITGHAMESGPEITAVTGHPAVTWVRITGIRAGDPAAADLVTRFGIAFDDVVSLLHGETGGAWELSLCLRGDIPEAEVLAPAGDLPQGAAGRLEHGLASVSLVGSGFFRDIASAGRAQRTLVRAGIEPARVIAGSLSLTFLVPRPAYAEAQRALHREFLES